MRLLKGSVEIEVAAELVSSLSTSKKGVDNYLNMPREINHPAKDKKIHRETLAKSNQPKHWKFPVTGNCWSRGATVPSLLMSKLLR